MIHSITNTSLRWRFFFTWKHCLLDSHLSLEQGGYVDLCHGVWKMQVSLAESRGIRDRHRKQRVTTKPKTKVLRIEHEHDLLILASDGLWDKVPLYVKLLTESAELPLPDF
ncbi:hypothetical protein RJT34_10029 [Clitoria ternatea]|uniref:PPM-type phosphatase domain-containing protein n=1 Tax=Clitoria ternatea TaxID=43366 RepID=A0AAN9PVS3_CLITE